MSTRKQNTPGAPLAQERYMSSAEFSELRGLSGTAVSAKAAIQREPEYRSLIWFLQRLSTAPGGLQTVAEDLVQMFPNGVSAHSYSDLHPEEVWRRFGRMDRGEPEPEYDLVKEAKQVAINGNGEKKDGRCFVPCLSEFLTSLCLDPEQSLDEDPIYFPQFVTALLEYKRAHEERAKAAFQSTAISKKVWETLDFAIRTNRMVVVEGLEGRGKTEAAKAWCSFHYGEARFVSLKGITNKTTAFREIAKALGVAATYKRKTTEMQARIEDVLQRSQIMLVIDEAHFLFSQSQRMYNRPELIDWIDTALCNQSVPVALVTTPQFLVCMGRASDQVGWNWRQFRRRVKRYVALAKNNSQEDVAAVARKLLPGASKETVKMIVGYAVLSKRDVSAVGDVAEEARLIAEDEGVKTINFRHVEQAINGQLIPSDKAFAERMVTRKSGRLVPPVEVAETPDVKDEDLTVSRSRTAPDTNVFRRADLVSA